MKVKRIIVNNLTKIYKNKKRKVIALNNVSFEAKNGQILSILGPNGAGKTTLLKILAGLILPDAGHILLDDEIDVIKNYEKIKRLIGFLPSSERSFYYRLTGWQNLEFFAVLMDIPPSKRKNIIKEILESIDFPEKIADRPFMTYSKGERQKLGLARALINNPPITLLDEPTSGLDPVACVEIRKLIVALKNMDKVVILCTHNLKEAEEISDYIIILNKGEIIKKGNPQILKSFVNKKYLKISFNSKEDIKQIQNFFHSSYNWEIYPERKEIRIEIKNTNFKEISSFLTSLLNYPEILNSMKVEEVSLEDLFFQLFSKNESDI